MICQRRSGSSPITKATISSKTPILGPWHDDGQGRETLTVWASEKDAGDPKKPNNQTAIADIVRPYHPLFKTVLTGKRVVDQMTSPPLNLTAAEAIERLTGSLFGPDGEHSHLHELADDPAISDEAGLRQATHDLAGREPTAEEIEDLPPIIRTTNDMKSSKRFWPTTWSPGSTIGKHAW